MGWAQILVISLAIVFFYLFYCRKFVEQRSQFQVLTQQQLNENCFRVKLDWNSKALNGELI